MKKLLIVLALIFVAACTNSTVVSKHKEIKEESNITKITDITIATVQKTIDMDLFRRNFSEKLNNVLQEKTDKDNEYIDSSVIVENTMNNKDAFYKKTMEEFSKRKLKVEEAESITNEIFSEILLNFLKEDIYVIMVQKSNDEKEFLAMYIMPDQDFKEFYIFTAYGDYL